MQTFTFKIKVSSTKIVCAANMQLEQFFDSVRMTDFSKLLEKYPYAYITASDYSAGEGWVYKDYALSPLHVLFDVKDLKSWLMSSLFVGFLGDDSYSSETEHSIVEKADNYLFCIDMDGDENVGDDTSVEEQEVSA